MVYDPSVVAYHIGPYNTHDGKLDIDNTDPLCQIIYIVRKPLNQPFSHQAELNIDLQTNYVQNIPYYWFAVSRAGHFWFCMEHGEGVDCHLFELANQWPCFNILLVMGVVSWETKHSRDFT